MQELPTGGAMVAVAASEDEVVPLLSDRVSVAAVNGPSSVVISGDEPEIVRVAEQLATRGYDTKRLTVSHAFHSARLDPMLGAFRQIADEVSYQAPSIPVVSTVTGQLADVDLLCSSAYWVDQVRRTVRFADSVDTLADKGVTTFVEVGPDGVLTALGAECLSGCDAVFVPTLRRDQEYETRALLTGAAVAHVRGVPVDWPAVFAGAEAQRVDLPTYAFDRQRLWLEPSEPTGDVTSIGLGMSDHPLLGAVVDMPDSDGVVFTSRLSLGAQPWLADHVVAGAVLMPGTGFVELVMRAGDEVGCGLVEELVIEAPLVLPEQDGVQLRVTVGEADEVGRRAVGVYSRTGDIDPDLPWTRHASGTLATENQEPDFDLVQWPPAGAQAEDIEHLYDDLVAAGYGYGPWFQGLQAAWVRGDEVFAEVALPDDEHEEASRYGLHPALLDTALHANSFRGGLQAIAGNQPLLPFAWNRVCLYASGASRLRVRVAPQGSDAITVQLADQAGVPVATVSSLVARPITDDQIGTRAGAPQEGMYRPEWTEVAVSSAETVLDAVPVVGTEDVRELAEAATSGTGIPGVLLLEVAGDDAEGAVGVRELACRVLGVVQAWLAEPGLADSRLVVVTRGSAAVHRDEELTDLAGAAVWGLLRSAQSEHPGRIVSIDVDGDENSLSMLPAALLLDEPQVAIRGGVCHAFRLIPVTADEGFGIRQLDPQGTVLITGGTGSLGRLVARRMVAEHGVRKLLLASRRGQEAPGAAELEAELAGWGATVRIVSCDLADRAAVGKLLASVPDTSPLTAVIHTAGVLADGVITALTAERLETVFSPKVDAVWNLHELTSDLDLAMFMVFSSAAGVFGGPGQGNYAAANAFLDAVARRRRSLGLPAVSLAWALWEQENGMTHQLGEVDKKRMARGGLVGLSEREGMALFDAGLRASDAVLVPAKLDLAALRTQAASGSLPSVLRGLVRVPRRAVRPSTGSQDGLIERLGRASKPDQKKILLNLVRGEAATVLGYRSADLVDADQAFNEIGFDSLTAVELRNSLSGATGLRLPATLIFDYPTSLDLADYLLAELGQDVNETNALLADLDALEKALLTAVPDEVAHTEILSRLRSLVDKWETVTDSSAGADEEFDFTSATDDEVFQIIDSEFGK
jgi:acyl carrier protein